MSTRVRKLTAAVSAAALIGAGAAGGVQAATNAQGPPPGGGRGHQQLSTTQLQKIATTLNVTTDQLSAAIKANRPAKPAGDDMATALATALGVDATKVKTILDANRPARPSAGTKPPAGAKPPAGDRPARGAKPDDSKLITALATGLSLDEATVKAAVDKLDADRQAAHETQETARYAAIAKSLGVDADAVKAAFEAARPAKPAK